MPATYEKIATTTLGSAAATIDFTSIGSGYTDLRLVLTAKGDVDQDTRFRLNNDTSVLYSFTRLWGDGATASSSRSTGNTSSLLTQSGIGDQFVLITMDLFSYAGSTFKTVLSTYSGDTNTTDGIVNRMVHLYRSTSAITQINLFQVSGNFVAGTTATLYGILKA